MNDRILLAYVKYPAILIFKKLGERLYSAYAEL